VIEPTASTLFTFVPVTGQYPGPWIEPGSHPKTFHSYASSRLWPTTQVEYRLLLQFTGKDRLSVCVLPEPAQCFRSVFTLAVRRISDGHIVWHYKQEFDFEPDSQLEIDLPKTGELYRKGAYDRNVGEIRLGFIVHGDIPA